MLSFPTPIPSAHINAIHQISYVRAYPQKPLRAKSPMATGHTAPSTVKRFLPFLQLKKMLNKDFDPYFS